MRAWVSTGFLLINAMVLTQEKKMNVGTIGKNRETHALTFLRHIILTSTGVIHSSHVTHSFIVQ